MAIMQNNMNNVIKKLMNNVRLHINAPTHFMKLILEGINDLSEEEKSVLHDVETCKLTGTQLSNDLQELLNKNQNKGLSFREAFREAFSLRTLHKDIQKVVHKVEILKQQTKAIRKNHEQSQEQNQEQENAQKEESKKEQSQKEEQTQKEEPTQTQEEKKNDTTQTRETDQKETQNEQKQQTNQTRENNQTQNESTNTTTYTPPQQDSNTEAQNREQTQENQAEEYTKEQETIDRQDIQNNTAWHQDRLKSAKDILKLIEDPSMQTDDKRAEIIKVLDEMNEKYGGNGMGDEDISYPQDAAELNAEDIKDIIQWSTTEINSNKRILGQSILYTTEDLEVDLHSNQHLDGDAYGAKTFKDFKGKETKFNEFDESTNCATIKFDEPVTEKDQETSIAGVQVHVRKNGLISFANAPGNPNRELLSHPEVIAEIVKLYPDSFKTIPDEVFATNPKLFAEAFKTGTIKMAESGELGNTSIEQYYFDAENDITQMCQRAMGKGTKEQNEAIEEVHDNSSVKLETNEEEIARADQELEEEMKREM